MRISNIQSQTVAIIGQGYVGLTLALAMANVGFNVIGVEKDLQIVEDLNAGKPYFHENGIEDTLKHCLRMGNYHCVNSIKNVSFDVLIIAVNTPLDNKTMSTDLTDLQNVCVELAPYIHKGQVIIQRSTAPVGTARKLVQIFKEISGLEAGLDFYFAVAPERTIEGEALKEIRALPQILGGFNDASAEVVARIFKPLVSLTIIVENMEAAELGKLICNASRLVSFGFANQVALLADQYNIDSNRLIKAVNEGYPRNPISLPSPGVGGICLKKDPYLLYESDHAGIASSLVIEARKASDQMPLYVVKKIMDFREKFYPGQSIKIFLLGFAFKGIPETSDTRDSNAWDVVNRLVEKDDTLKLYGFDPVIPKEKLSHANVKFVDFDEGWHGAQAIVLLNNHKFFSKMDIYKAINLVSRPCLIFDTWNMLYHEGLLAEDGIIIQTLGSRRTHSLGG
jgi:nucleotide sugar dehydrogenase